MIKLERYPRILASLQDQAGDFSLQHFVTGLASASSLFLAACGLSIIFGVTRIVNFSHGAFYMLGAYVGFTLTERFSGDFGFWGGIVLASLIVAALGALVEMTLLRRDLCGARTASIALDLRRHARGRRSGGADLGPEPICSGDGRPV